MARCGCLSTCNCLIQALDTPCIDTTVSGIGTPQSPYIVSAVPKISACVGNGLTCQADGLCAIAKINTLDTPCVDFSGDGTLANPISAVITLSPDTDNVLGPNFSGSGDSGCTPNGFKLSVEDVQDAIGQEIGPALAGTCLVYNDASNEIDVQIAPDVADPGAAVGNGVECGVNGLLVAPSADAGNTITFGADGRLYAAGAALVGDTDNDNCVNVAITGTGTAVDPFVLEGSLVIDPNGCNAASCGPAGLLVPQTDLTAQTLTGQPCISVAETPGCPDTWDIRLGIAPDPCNALECHGDGLFVGPIEFSQPLGVQNGNQGGFGNTVVNGTFLTQIGPTVCETLTNPSTCRPMQILENDLFDADISANSGQLTAFLERSVNGSPFAGETEIGHGGGTPYHELTAATAVNNFGAGPGQTATFCQRAQVRGVNVVNGLVRVSWSQTLFGTVL